VIPTFCAPRSGNQKGSVERLVGYTKHSFLFARKFKDRADLATQLGEWLREVNHTRRSDATGVIPEVARQDELRWLRGSGAAPALSGGGPRRTPAGWFRGPSPADASSASGQGLG